jgi:ATP-dependent DNA helicase RecQ
MEPKYLQIPKAVYEVLKDRMEKRVNAVLDYSFRGDKCREAMLLEYFGDTGHPDCGHCDVCIEHKKVKNHTSKDVQDGILYMAQVKPRKIEEFIDTLSFPRDEIFAMVSFLVDEGFLQHLDDDTYKNPIPLK